LILFALTVFAVAIMRPISHPFNGIVAIAILLGSLCALIEKANCSPLMSVLADSYTTFQPGLIVDVGANEGEWSLHVNSLWPEAALLMLEADSQHKKSLSEIADKTNGSFTIGVFSSKEGETVDFYAGGDTGNSMFKENTHHFANDVPVQKKTMTIDGVVLRSGIRKPVDILKLDIQGAELLALQGATKVLSEATFVQLEASTIVYNDGAPCHFQVEAYLREKGFFLYDLAEMHYNMDAFKTAGTGQYDALYIRPTSDRLPNELKDAKFCTDSTYSTKIIDKNENASAQDKSHQNPVLYLLGGFVAGVVFCWIMVPRMRLRKRSLQ
jgi:FkbM family methyltransferase